jgi:hypothetical protein
MFKRCKFVSNCAFLNMAFNNKTYVLLLKFLVLLLGKVIGFYYTFFIINSNRFLINFNIIFIFLIKIFIY